MNVVRKLLLKTFVLLGLVGVFTPMFAECLEGAPIATLEIRGLEHTQKHVVERELLNRSGTKFSQENYETEKLRLQDLDIFSEISVDCQKQGADSVTVVYSFKEIFRWIPAPAGKKTDRDGMMLGLALANLNVFGEDIRAEVQYRTAVDPVFEKNEYAFYASSPYFAGHPLGWNLEFLRTDSWDDLRKFDDQSVLLDLDLDYGLNGNFSLLLSGAYRYLQGGAGHLPEIGTGFAIDFRDASIDTRNGIYMEFALTHVGAGVGNGKGENYTEFLGDGRAYLTLGRWVSGATALFRYRSGRVQNYDYFYHGGANTFRGHEADSNSLGINEMLLTKEERFVLMERHAASLWNVNFFYGIQLVAGLDGSLLWDEGCPGWKDYEGAVYGGVHLVIPALDRVRFEVGYSPDRGEPVFYFGLFDTTNSARWRSR